LEKVCHVHVKTSFVDFAFNNTTLILIPVPATRELSCVPSTIHLAGVIVNQIRSYKILFKDAWYALLKMSDPDYEP
jgi:hypothetical protein